MGADNFGSQYQLETLPNGILVDKDLSQAEDIFKCI